MSQLSMPQKSLRWLPEQMYLLLAKQVKSYHKHRHMGDNSSVPAELARELMASTEYTLGQLGPTGAGGSLEEALALGQVVLEGKVKKARSTLDLVFATAPSWQSECRWDALSCLSRYLAGYDHLHLARRIPEDWFYPVLTAAPDGTLGIDLCLFYLNVLWWENQIMACLDDRESEPLWALLAQDAYSLCANPCEQLLINALGKALLSSPDGLTFSDAERGQLYALLRGMDTHALRAKLNNGVFRICDRWALADPHAAAYARSITKHLLPRLEVALQHEALEAVFL